MNMLCDAISYGTWQWNERCVVESRLIECLLLMLTFTLHCRFDQTVIGLVWMLDKKKRRANVHLVHLLRLCRWTANTPHFPSSIFISAMEKSKTLVRQSDVIKKKALMRFSSTHASTVQRTKRNRVRKSMTIKQWISNDLHNIHSFDVIVRVGWRRPWKMILHTRTQTLTFICVCTNAFTRIQIEWKASKWICYYIDIHYISPETARWGRIYDGQYDNKIL